MFGGRTKKNTNSTVWASTAILRGVCATMQYELLTAVNDDMNTDRYILDKNLWPMVAWHLPVLKFLLRFVKIFSQILTRISKSPLYFKGKPIPPT